MLVLITESEGAVNQERLQVKQTLLQAHLLHHSSSTRCQHADRVTCSASVGVSVVILPSFSEGGLYLHS